MAKPSANTATMMAKIIFAFIVLNFSYFTNVGIMFDISVGRVKFFCLLGVSMKVAGCGLRFLEMKRLLIIQQLVQLCL